MLEAIGSFIGFILKICIGSLIVGAVVKYVYDDISEQQKKKDGEVSVQILPNVTITWGIDVNYTKVRHSMLNSLLMLAAIEQSANNQEQKISLEVLQQYFNALEKGKFSELEDSNSDNKENAEVEIQSLDGSVKKYKLKDLEEKLYNLYKSSPENEE